MVLVIWTDENEYDDSVSCGVASSLSSWVPAIRAGCGVGGSKARCMSRSLAGHVEVVALHARLSNKPGVIPFWVCQRSNYHSEQILG